MAKRSGFTLIELMVVVAVIAVLAAVAMPVYGDYVKRARGAEALLAAGPIKAAVVENIVGRSILDGQACLNVDSGAASLRDVASINCIGNGVIQLTTSPAAGSVTLNLVPVLNAGGMVSWTCEIVAGSARHAPVSCRSL